MKCLKQLSFLTVQLPPNWFALNNSRTFLVLNFSQLSSPTRRELSMIPPFWLMTDGDSSTIVIRPSSFMPVSCFCYNGANWSGPAELYAKAKEFSFVIFIFILVFFCFCFRAEQTPSTHPEHSALFACSTHFCWNVPVRYKSRLSRRVRRSLHLLAGRAGWLSLGAVSLSRSILIECKSWGQSLWTLAGRVGGWPQSPKSNLDDRRPARRRMSVPMM